MVYSIAIKKEVFELKKKGLSNSEIMSKLNIRYADLRKIIDEEEK